MAEIEKIRKRRRTQKSWQEEELAHEISKADQIKKQRRQKRIIPKEDALAGEEEKKIIRLDSRRPVKAESLHIGEQVSLKREPIAEEREEKINFGEEIEKFRDTEKEYIGHIIMAYPGEFRAAKAKIEKNGGTADEKWLAVFRESYISDRVRWGLDKDRWGSGGPLAPEKAEILKKYLELKLPAGIPEKPEENKPENPEATNKPKEESFTPEQASKLLALIREARKIQDQVDPVDLKEVIEEIIREDLIAKGIFAEENFQRAFGHVIRWIQKLNDKK